ncbi:MAG: hypothetical protein QW589_04275 [Candidatus Bathyarchaeia archaeon]
MSKKLLEHCLITFFFMAIAYIFLGTNLIEGKIAAPMDLLLSFAGWKESGISLPLFNNERSDVVDAILPRWIFLRSQIIGKKLPLWNPLVAGGEPAFLLPLIMAFLSISAALWESRWRKWPLSPMFWIVLIGLTLVAIY